LRPWASERAAPRPSGGVSTFFAEVAQAAGADRRLDAAVDDLRDQLLRSRDLEVRARSLVEKMALVLQGALLVRHGHPAVADAFCASRLQGDWGRAFGTLPTGLDLRAIVERATPKLG